MAWRRRRLYSSMRRTAGGCPQPRKLNAGGYPQEYREFPQYSGRLLSNTGSFPNNTNNTRILGNVHVLATLEQEHR